MLHHGVLCLHALCCFRVPDIDAAIKMANSTEFGLGGSVWTEDKDEQDRFIRVGGGAAGMMASVHADLPKFNHYLPCGLQDVECGFLAINGMVASDPRLPIGGSKKSGYGRELGQLGIREFVNAKTVHKPASPGAGGPNMG